MSRTLFGVFLVLFVSTVHCHMWLMYPVSRGGEANIGGTTAPCNNLNPANGATTNLIMGQVNTIVFRVNKHGEGPFRISLSPTGDDKGYDTAANILVNNFKYVITADGGNNFNEMHVNVTLPNVAMPKASLQLKGMGDANGVGAWYQCANVVVGPAPSCPANCETGSPVHGKCQGAKCVCNTGFSGADCSVSIAVNGGVNAATTLNVAPEKFDKTLFVTKLSTALGVPASSIEIITVSPVKNQPSQTQVVFVFKDTPTQSAISTNAKYNDYVSNSQIDAGYPIVSSSSAGTEITQEQIKENAPKKKTSGGAIAAAILVPVAVVAAVAAVLVYKKKNTTNNANRAPAVPMRI